MPFTKVLKHDINNLIGKKMTKFIISVHPTSEKEALLELKEHFNKLQLKKLSTGVFLCELAGSIDLVSKKVHQERICFIRHIVPVDLEFNLSNTPDDYEIFSQNTNLILPLIKVKNVHAVIKILCLRIILLLYNVYQN